MSVILPCLGRTERDVQATGPQFVTVRDSMSMVHASAGRLPPASEQLRSEPAIVAGIAAATLPNTRVRWADLVANYDLIRDAIVWGVSRLPRLQRPRPQARRIQAAAAADRARLADAFRAHPVPMLQGACRGRRRRGLGSLEADDGPQPQTIQQDDL